MSNNSWGIESAFFRQTICLYSPIKVPFWAKIGILSVKKDNFLIGNFSPASVYYTYQTTNKTRQVIFVSHTL